MYRKSVIKELSQLHAVSGYEFRISDKISKMFQKYCDEVTIDNLGNIIGRVKCSIPNARTVMLEAHIDEIGMMVTDIDDRGFLYFTSIGGIDARILSAKEVVVHGKKDILGIIGAKPPHITTAEERNTAIPMKDLYIDTGYTFKDISSIVSVGDTVTFADGYRDLGKKYISTKSQDDRTSVAVLLYVMQNIKKEALEFDVCFCACVQEEVGRRGAASAASIIDPVFAVAVDVCHASTPDASSDTFKSGSGTVISRGPNIHPKLLEHTLDILDKSKIKYNIDVDCDDTGTDAWAIQVAKCGIPTILFSLPLRYMHTMVETVNFDDVKSTADAITALITNTKDAEAVVCMD